MDWTQAISIMATVVATGYYIHREIQNDMRAQTARTDRLYEMFIDLLKEKK
jgi:Ni,Fe-hydrogenase I cytochrome b subunit